MTKEQMEKKCEELLALARGFLRKKAPYIGRTIYGLVPCPAYGLGTMGVTQGLVLYYDPEWLLSEPDFQRKDARGNDNGHEVIAACLYHECNHILRDMERIARLPNGELANKAADLPINHDLREAGWVLPSWALYPETYNFKPGLSMEAYYELLSKMPPPPPSPKGGGKGKGQSGGQGGQQKQQHSGPCAGKCGGIGGNSQDKALEKKLDEAVGRHKADVERVKKSTLHDIKDHMAAHGRGSAPGFSEEDLKYERKRPLVNWERRVNHVIRRATGSAMAGTQDYSMSKMNRRAAFTGIIKPGLVDQLCTVLFIRDTSASMGTKQLQVANNEIVGCVQSLGIEDIWLMDVDTKVQRPPTKVRVSQVPKLAAKGRGGTSFFPAVEAIDKMRPKPDVAIYLTDGDGAAPPHPPKGVAFIWCIVPTGVGVRPAKWGHLVVCSNDQKLVDQYDDS